MRYVCCCIVCSEGLFVILEEHSILNLARKPEDSKLLEAFDETHDKVHPCYVSATAGLDFAIKVTSWCSE